MKVKTVGTIVAAVAGAAGMWWIVSKYQKWNEETVAATLQNTCIANTAIGPVEYRIQGSGPAVLLVHAAPGGSDQIKLMQRLSTHGFTVICPSRPGYLQTPISLGQTFSEQATMLAELLNTLQIQQAAVVALSTGAPVALTFAAEHPDRVWALSIESGVSQAYEPADAAMKEGPLGPLFENVILVNGFMWIVNRITHHFLPHLLGEYIKYESSHSTAEVERCVQEVVDRPHQLQFVLDFVDSTTPYSLRKQGTDNDMFHMARLNPLNLAAINAPTLVLHSPVDTDVPFAHAEHTAAGIPNSRLVPLDAGGHLIWITADGDRLRETRLQFLRQHIPAHMQS